MKRQGLVAVALWVALLVACMIVISRASFTADLSAFLPRAPTAEQQVLVDQLTEGAVSRLILIGTEAPDSAAHGRGFRGDCPTFCCMPEFTLLNNGESLGNERDRDFRVQPPVPAKSPRSLPIASPRRGCGRPLARASISLPRPRVSC